MYIKTIYDLHRSFFVENSWGGTAIYDQRETNYTKINSYRCGVYKPHIIIQQNGRIDHVAEWNLGSELIRCAINWMHLLAERGKLILNHRRSINFISFLSLRWRYRLNWQWNVCNQIPKLRSTLPQINPTNDSIIVVLLKDTQTHHLGVINTYRIMFLIHLLVSIQLLHTYTHSSGATGSSADDDLARIRESLDKARALSNEICSNTDDPLVNLKVQTKVGRACFLSNFSLALLFLWQFFLICFPNRISVSSYSCLCLVNLSALISERSNSQLLHTNNSNQNCIGIVALMDDNVSVNNILQQQKLVTLLCTFAEQLVSDQ